MYSPKVSATILVSVGTSTIWKIPGTKSTLKLYTGESGSDDGYETDVENAPTCAEVGNLFGDAVITIQAEISELDLVDFDETLLVGEYINE